MTGWGRKKPNYSAIKLNSSSCSSSLCVRAAAAAAVTATAAGCQLVSKEPHRPLLYSIVLLRTAADGCCCITAALISFDSRQAGTTRQNNCSKAIGGATCYWLWRQYLQDVSKNISPPRKPSNRGEIFTSRGSPRNIRSFNVVVSYTCWCPASVIGSAVRRLIFLLLCI